jgi:4-hydroxy-2-oxoglutarate aldolase
VAAASPVSILVYNYARATNGIDLDSDAIIELAEHTSIVGCKLTCENTGKLIRIASSTQSAMPAQESDFVCMGGSADFTLQTLVAGESGVIAGLGNLTLKAYVKICELHAAGEVA